MAMGKLISCIRVTLLHYCFFASLLLAVRVRNINTDKEALLALKLHITHDPYNLLQTNWSNNSNSVCNWVGITCGSFHHRVIALNISNMGLTGTIPPHLGNLSFLVSISFSNNSFYGSLPNELAHLRRMKSFNFAINNLRGKIPSWIGSFTQLQLLNLSVNNLSGSIPSTIFNISSLQKIIISDNWLSGSIPITSSVTNMPSLRTLDFTINNLTGPLPLNICSHFPNLEGLFLSLNQFYGVIPSTLYLCSQLKFLSLSVNNFQGSIHTDIGNLTMLQQLYLGLNNFSGTEIPTAIGNLFNLEGLSLARSGLTGIIPSTIGNLTLLKLLDLSENGLTGSIPSEIGNLPNLKKVHLGINNLVGLVPSGIYNTSTLMSMTLTINQLSGQLPVSIGVHLPNLKHLLIGGNYFSGPIPIYLSNASELIKLDLSTNSFFGPIPDALGNLKNLERLNLEENHLTTKSFSSGLSIFSSLTNCKYLRFLSVSLNPLNGILPISLANLSSSLKEFHAYGCGITGNIPKEIGNLSSLSTLDLEINDLRGTIPTTIAKLQKLQALYLNANKLQGSIPCDELCDLKSLVYLDLGGNELTGPIPSCLGNVTSLRILYMEMNKFISAIPSSLWRLKDILEVDLSSNSLTGSLPLDISNLKAVTLLNLSGNQLSGDIPYSFGSLKALTNLSLSNNRLEGSIPQSLGDTISLEFLDLSNNSLSGEIPKSLEKLLLLGSFNVSFNELEGEIPNGGPFTNFSVQSFLGNKGLCGAPRLKLQPCKVSIHRQSKTSKTMRYILLAIGSIIILTLAFVIVFIRHRKRNLRVSNQEQLLPLATWTRISFEQLKQATDKFNEINLLGRGNFGSVYKGTLQDGMNVAVKVFNLQLEGGFKSFDVECEVLRGIRHRNLIKIITACCNIDFKALVLEFMPNWSLEKWLYSHNYFLDIMQRLNIMVDVALALEYLHYGSTTPVVHCDLKPSNILLDEDMVGHVSDFGIAKLLGEEHSIMQTMTLATVGYMAPEYGSEGLVSIRGDMYSYGILLMETFTRKKPTDKMFTEEMSMKQWVRDSLSLPCGVAQIADANILKSDERHFSAKKECISSTMALAQKCCSDLPEERTDVRYVLNSLKTIKVKFLKDIGRT